MRFTLNRRGIVFLVSIFYLHFVDPAFASTVDATSDQALCEREYQDDVVFTKIPYIFDVDKYNNKIDSVINKIIVKGTSGYLWNGIKIDEKTLDQFIDSAINMSMSEFQISPYDHSKFEKTLNLLKILQSKNFTNNIFTDNWLFEEFNGGLFVNNEKYCKYSSRIVTVRAYAAKHRDNNGANCIVFWDDRSVDDSEFYRLANAFNADFVKSDVGSKAVQGKTIADTSVPTIVITGAPDLPWECVAGPMFGLESAGFVHVGLLAKRNQLVYFSSDGA